jgi:hypothetical protein
MGSIIKLAGDKIEVPVDFHGAQVKAKPSGGWEIKCPSCGEKTTLTDVDIKNAGQVLGGSPRTPVFQAVAHGLRFVHGWNRAMAMTEKDGVDYVDWRLEVAKVLVDQNTWSGDSSTMASTSLKLGCQHSVDLSFGEHITVAKEADRVQVLLRRGIKSERSFRYLAYVDTGEGRVKLGQEKAEQLTQFIRETESDKTKIQELSEKILKEIEKSKPFFYGDFSKVASFIEVAAGNDFKLLSAAQKEKLDALDKALLRIAGRPLVR